MKPVSLYNDIASTSYPGRGIVIGKSADGSKAVIAYFIMGRSENSRNRVFAETEDGIKTQEESRRPTASHGPNPYQRSRPSQRR